MDGKIQKIGKEGHDSFFHANDKHKPTSENHLGSLVF